MSDNKITLQKEIKKYGAFYVNDMYIKGMNTNRIFWERNKGFSTVNRESLVFFIILHA